MNINELLENLADFRDNAVSIAGDCHHAIDMDEQLEQAIDLGLLSVSQVDKIWRLHNKIVELAEELNEAIGEAEIAANQNRTEELEAA